ncbi:MAG: hypothetical protein IT215_06025 [Chitinophagaceae bacterium]|nr:hypothetical protein [Chitinophagaceae bacterium]
MRVLLPPKPSTPSKVRVTIEAAVRPTCFVIELLSIESNVLFSVFCLLLSAVGVVLGSCSSLMF